MNEAKELKNIERLLKKKDAVLRRYNNKIHKIENCKLNYENITLSEKQRKVYETRQEIKKECFGLEEEKATIFARILRNLENELNVAYANNDVGQFNFMRNRIEKWFGNFYDLSRVYVGDVEDKIRISVDLSSIYDSRIEKILNGGKEIVRRDVWLNEKVK